MVPTNNPYAPPKARDLELPPQTAQGPNEHVEWACKLIWIGVGVSTLESILEAFLNPGSGAGELTAYIVGGVIGLAITFAIAYWFTNYLRAGRNWMRWLITILTTLGLLIMAVAAVFIPRSFLTGMFATAPLTMANMGIQLLLSVAELVLINTPAARDWFRARSLD